MPFAGAYRHRRDWQRSGRKLPGQHTSPPLEGRDDREEVLAAASIKAAGGSGLSDMPNTQ